MDVASRYKAAEALASKDSDKVARGFAKIYKKGPLKWPQMLQVDHDVDVAASGHRCCKSTRGVSLWVL